jgi:hypothetical protein
MATINDFLNKTFKGATKGYTSTGNLGGAVLGGIKANFQPTNTQTTSQPTPARPTPLNPVQPTSKVTENSSATSMQTPKPAQPSVAPRPTRTLPKEADAFISSMQPRPQDTQAQAPQVIEPIPEKKDPYLSYLDSLFEQTSTAQSKRQQEFQRVADIQARNRKAELDAIAEQEAIRTEGGRLKGGAESMIGEVGRKANLESAFGALEESAAISSANLANDVYNQYIQAGATSFEARNAAQAAEREEVIRQENLAMKKQELEATLNKPLVVGEGSTLIDPTTGRVIFRAPKTTASGGSGGVFGGSSSVGTPAGASGVMSSLAQIAREIAPTNSKFANEQFLSNAQFYIDSGDDVGLSNLIRKQAVNQLPSAEIKGKYLNNISLIENLNNLENIMAEIESSGVDTNIFTGTRQSILNKVGKIGDPNLVDLTQQAMNIRDLLARSRSGAALTESEERLYKKMIPSVFRTEELNSQIAKNLRQSLETSIDSATGFSLSKQQLGQLTDKKQTPSASSSETDTLLSQYGL